MLNIACHDACNSLLHVSSGFCGSTDHRNSQINKICTSREVEQAAWAVQCHVDQRAVNKNGILDSSSNSFCSNLVIGFHCHCYHLQHCQSTLQNYCHSVCSVCSTCSSDDCSCGSRERNPATVSAMSDSTCSGVECSCGNAGTAGKRSDSNWQTWLAAT